MMNKSLIEWCDFTWNPVTGCLSMAACIVTQLSRRTDFLVMC